MRATNYVIGSGWWSADEALDQRDYLHGDSVIRSSEFHKLWYLAIDRFTNPQKIIIVDSASPVKPDYNRSDPRLEFVSLSHNAGHSTHHTGKYCGCVRAMLLGMEYALQCGIDYYVYIEQDALIYGDGIIEHCVGKMKTPYMFGPGEGTPLKTQQSLFIMRSDGIRKFMRRLHSMREYDSAICPEDKYHIACSHLPTRIHTAAYMNKNRHGVFRWLDWQLFKYFRNYDDLPIGVGRARPLNTNDEFFYFQQASREEIDLYLKKTDFVWPT